MDIKDLASFEKFLSPILIKIAYWIGIIALAFASLSMIFTAYGYFGRGFTQIIAGILLFIGGFIVLRLTCEGIILTFKMYDRLTEIKDRLPRE